MSNPSSIIHSSTLLLALAALTSACGSSDGEPEGPGENNGGSGNVTGNGGTGNDSASCTESELFPPQSYGDNGSDLIRHIELAADGAIYYSNYADVYVVRPGSSSPELVVARPSGSFPLYGEFWLNGSDLIFPSTDSTDIDDASMDVLYAVGLDGLNERVLFSTPTPTPEDFSYGVNDGARVLGGELFWIEERIVRENTGLGERTLRAKRQSFSAPSDVSPSNAVQWHEAIGSFDGLIVTSNLAFLSLNFDDMAGTDEQRIIRWADGSVEPMTAEQRFGGEVVAADDASVIVTTLSGVFRHAPDGAEDERLGAFLTSSGNITSRDGRWAYAEYDYQTQTENIYVYDVGSAPRRLGCIDARGTTLHAVALTEDEVLISRYRDSTATLVRFPL